MALEKEKEVFENNVLEWRSSHMGEFVVIKDDQVIGFYKTLEGAFSDGTKRFGLQDFFVKQVIPQDAVNVSFLGRSIRTVSP